MTNNFSINQRIRKIVASKEHYQYDAADKLGISRGYLNKVLQPNGPVGLPLIIKVLETYKDVDARWLLIGEGEMLRESNIVEDPRAVYKTLSDQLALNKKVIEGLLDKLREDGQ